MTCVTLARVTPSRRAMSACANLIETVPDRIPEPDRTWFAVAAYNVGFGHVEDARILTQQHGRNPDLWEDVREFLPLLTQERWYTRTRRGYARGWEPVRYVDNVQAYLNILAVAGVGAPALGCGAATDQHAGAAAAACRVAALTHPGGVSAVPGRNS